MVREYTLERYARQLPLIGIDGQRKLLKSTALVVGAGGLGSSVLPYLVAAGVGRILIVDKGYVDLPDLNRQVLYSEDDLGKAKAIVAAERLRRLNSSISIVSYIMDVTDKHFEELVMSADVIVDCLDNWTARFVLNELAVKHLKPLVHAGVQEFYGQATTVIPGQTPCLKCIVPKASDRGEPIPIIGFTPAVLGSIEASEVIKILLGEKPALAGILLVVDLKNVEFSKIRIVKKSDCPVCGAYTSAS
ncbi:MAG: HesA/MoeB/ThiF family protein [Sulfolobales archaeon]